MKRDINLMPTIPLNRTNIIFLTISIIIVLVLSFTILPIQKRNRLIDESQKINKELVNYNELSEEYYSLEQYSINLQKRIELFNKVKSNQNDISLLFDTVDNSIPSYIGLSDISVSGNILSIKGRAPNDKIIADMVIELLKQDKISSVRIQEISLDKKDLKRIFHIECITLFNNLDIGEVFMEEQDSTQSDLGGNDD